MIIVTGGAGFIGSNLVRALNAAGDTDILIVDRLGENFRNLSDVRFSDFMEPDEFRSAIERKNLSNSVDAIFHQGACADTTCSDGHFMMENNFSFSKVVLHYAIEKKVPLIYASSASVYGASQSSEPAAANERPLNLYALSKLAFDNHVRGILNDAASTVVGLRYFNVYGPGERHKGRMASMVYQLYRQLKETGRVHLFEGTDGYANGEQRRDFVFVDDIVRLNIFFTKRKRTTRGIFNAGTGTSRSFNDIAKSLFAVLGKGEIQYFPFPAELKGKYQSFTQANVTELRGAGWDEHFTSLEDGIARSVSRWDAEA